MNEFGELTAHRRLISFQSWYAAHQMARTYHLSLQSLYAARHHVAIGHTVEPL